MFYYYCPIMTISMLTPPVIVNRLKLHVEEDVDAKTIEAATEEASEMISEEEGVIAADKDIVLQ